MDRLEGPPWLKQEKPWTGLGGSHRPPSSAYKHEKRNDSRLTELLRAATRDILTAPIRGRFHRVRPRSPMARTACNSILRGHYSAPRCAKKLIYIRGRERLAPGPRRAARRRGFRIARAATFGGQPQLLNL
ncbi:hypothetical protein EVAR_33625_1 [Eumeta japonica]|uniref:Uncharacterized protein n=1 Tax=Eumeta variegata TaxID=151549 RepID=A0A4C1W950_EUMVA|nr:hypothetical protein EVAR_33625_1 [Eumeta japonica]